MITCYFSSDRTSCQARLSIPILQFHEESHVYCIDPISNHRILADDEENLHPSFSGIALAKSLRHPKLSPREDALLRVLQIFCWKYLPDVEVNYGRRRGAYGFAIVWERRIFLRPNLPLDLRYQLPLSQSGFDRLKLRDGEQYFIILLHEIAHFYSRESLPPSDFTRFIRDSIRTQQFWRRHKDTYEEVFGKKFDEDQLKEELWHIEIDKWAIYQFRKRRREIRDALRKEGLYDLCEKDKPRGPQVLASGGSGGI